MLCAGEWVRHRRIRPIMTVEITSEEAKTFRKREGLVKLA